MSKRTIERAVIVWMGANAFRKGLEGVKSYGVQAIGKVTPTV